MITPHATYETLEDTGFNDEVVAEDADDAVLTYSVQVAPGKGTVTFSDANSGVFTYSPTAHENGSDSFTIAVSDGEATVTQNYDVAITAVNDLPEITPTVYETNEDETLSSFITAVDVDLDELTYTLHSQAALGTVSIPNSSQGAFLYTPIENQNGTDSFEVAVSDGVGETVYETFTLNLISVNDLPVVTPQASAYVFLGRPPPFRPGRCCRR